MTQLTRPLSVSIVQRTKITLGLAMLGALAGATAGGISAVLVIAIGEWSLRELFDRFLFSVGAAIGAPLGALLLPLAAWTVMRNVPFGRAVAGTVAGTLVGGLMGWYVSLGQHALLRSLCGGVVGFVLAAFLLRRQAR